MKKHDIWLDCGAGTMFKLSEVTAVSRVTLFELEYVRFEGPRFESAQYPCSLTQFRKFIHLIHEEDQWLHCAQASVRLSAIYKIADGCAFYYGCTQQDASGESSVKLPSQYLRSSNELTLKGRQLLQKIGSIVPLTDIEQRTGEEHED